MEAKEKAQELFSQYRFALSVADAPLGEQKDAIAKHCVWIAVNEIIETGKKEKSLKYWLNQETIKFWEAVKTEIQNL